MYMDETGMFMMMAWIGILTLGILAAVGAVVIWLTRGSGTGRPDPGSRAAEAEALLRNRYAAGEIDDEEYLRRLAVLYGQHPRKP